MLHGLDHVTNWLNLTSCKICFPENFYSNNNNYNKGKHFANVSDLNNSKRKYMHALTDNYFLK